MRSLPLLVLALLLAGCGSLGALGPNGGRAVLGGSDASGNRIYFSGDETTIKEDLKNTSAVYDLSSMESGIDYLLRRLESTPYKLERNGVRYRPAEAVEFLRWKMDRPRWRSKVSSVQDFVTVICAGSITTGKPYEVILPGGSRHNLQAVFQNELDLLEDYLAQ